MPKSVFFRAKTNEFQELTKPNGGAKAYILQPKRSPFRLQKHTFYKLMQHGSTLYFM